MSVLQEAVALSLSATSAVPRDVFQKHSEKARVGGESHSLSLSRSSLSSDRFFFFFLRLQGVDPRQLAGEDVGSQSIVRVGVRAQVDNDVGVLRALGHGFYEVRQEFFARPYGKVARLFDVDPKKRPHSNTNYTIFFTRVFPAERRKMTRPFRKRARPFRKWARKFSGIDASKI